MKARATIVTGAHRVARAKSWIGYAIADMTIAVSAAPFLPVVVEVRL
jgi:hypothetical protein